MLLFALRFSDSTLSSFCVSSVSFFIVLLKANKSMAYFQKQYSEYREINQNQKQVILQLQRDLSGKDRNIDNLIAQVNELIEDTMSVETFSDGEYLPSVRQVVQDLHSFGVGVKHIGQTIQTVLKHLVGIEGVKVPSESSRLSIFLSFPDKSLCSCKITCF
jgi:hypothetical protein